MVAKLRNYARAAPNGIRLTRIAINTLRSDSREWRLIESDKVNNY